MVSKFDLQDLYKMYFNTTPYFIANKGTNKSLTQEIAYSEIEKNPNPKGTIQRSKGFLPFNKINAYGCEVWGAIVLKVSDTLSIEIDACTVSINLSKIIIKTPVSERAGTIKECFSLDDYRFNIKGFLIDKNRRFPENQINMLKQIFESTDPVYLHGGYPELFLDASCRVAISNLDFPEVQGKSPWIRPFSLTCETDTIEDLIIKD